MPGGYNSINVECLAGIYFIRVVRGESSGAFEATRLKSVAVAVILEKGETHKWLLACVTRGRGGLLNDRVEGLGLQHVWYKAFSE